MSIQTKTHNDPNEATETDMSVTTLASKRLDELRAFYIAIDDPVLQKEAENDDVFATIMQLAIDDYGVSQKELAEILKIKPSTVGRWRQGQTVPSVYARPGILAALCTLLSQCIALRENK